MLSPPLPAQVPGIGERSVALGFLRTGRGRVLPLVRGNRNSGTVLDLPLCAACSSVLARLVFGAAAGTELDWGTRSSLLLNYQRSVPLQLAVWRLSGGR